MPSGSVTHTQAAETFSEIMALHFPSDVSGGIAQERERGDLDLVCFVLLVVFGVAVVCLVVVLSCVCVVCAHVRVCACAWDEALKAVGRELFVAEYARLIGVRTAWFRSAGCPVFVWYGCA